MPDRDPAAGASGPGMPSSRPQIVELRRYRFRFGEMETRYAEYARTALIPALNRAGVGPVGAFTVALGPDNPSLHLLLPHPDADSVATLPARLAADPEYRRAGERFRALPPGDPLYVAREASLMVAFDTLPAVVVPKPPLAPPASRLFELRTYVSHGEAAHFKKIEMFETAGEIAIFRRLGIVPVLFARNLAGPPLPSLSYLVAFADAAAREAAWAAFREDPAWVELRSTPGYTGAEILASTHHLLLRSTEDSQI